MFFTKRYQLRKKIKVIIRILKNTFIRISDIKKIFQKKELVEAHTPHLLLLAASAVSFWVIAAAHHAPREKVKLY